VTEAPSAGVWAAGAVGAAVALPGAASANSRANKKTVPRTVCRGARVDAMVPPRWTMSCLTPPPARAGVVFLVTLYEVRRRPVLPRRRVISRSGRRPPGSRRRRSRERRGSALLARVQQVLRVEGLLDPRGPTWSDHEGRPGRPSAGTAARSAGGRNQGRFGAAVDDFVAHPPTLV